MSSETFNYTGSEQTTTVPSGVTKVVAECYGAGGGTGRNGGASGGVGAYAKREFAVTGGETLYVYVGGRGDDGADQGAGGWNGGAPGGDGTWNGGGGGGASDVRQGGNTLSDRVAVAGGGGGGGGNAGSSGEVGGDGGYNGGDGGGGSSKSGDGGTQSTGGAGGTNDTNGFDGSLGDGGAGGGDNGSGGGGAGGYYGGGGGAGGSNEGGGGGGGSSLADTATTGGGNSGDGQVVLTYVPAPPTLDSLDTSTEREITLSWTNEATYDNINIYRATASGSSTGDYTLIDTIGGSNTTYTDTGLDDGERYYYRLTGIVDGEETDVSNERNGLTILPAPTGLATSNIAADTADLSWTDNHNNGDVRVEYKPTSTSSWMVEETVALGTQSSTLTSLRNGEAYDARVVAVTEHTETVDA